MDINKDANSNEVEENQIVEDSPIEELLIEKNTTKLDKNAYIELSQANIPNIIVVGIIGGLAVILMGFMISHFKIDALSITLTVFGVLYPLFLYLFLKRGIKKSAERQAQIMGDSSTLTYCFYEKYFDIEFQSSSQNSNVRVDYKNIIKVIETPKYLFLFIMARQAYIVDKSGFELSYLENLRKILKTNVNKYVVKKGK